MAKINESIAANMKSLESRLVREIKDAVSDVTQRETEHLRAELDRAKQQCLQLQTEIQSLRNGLKEHKESLSNNVGNTPTTSSKKHASCSQAEAMGTDGVIQAQAVAAPAATARPAPVPGPFVPPVPAPAHPAFAPAPPASAARPVTYAAVARKTAEMSIKMMHPVRKGGNRSNIPIKAVERRKYLHLWRLLKGTTEEDLTDYIRTILEDISYLKVDKIVHKTERNYSSFRICVSESDFEKLCCSEIWPADAEYSEWTWFRGSTKTAN